MDLAPCSSLNVKCAGEMNPNLQLFHDSDVQTIAEGATVLVALSFVFDFNQNCQQLGMILPRPARGK
jgi:hypothetical protein